MSAADHKRALRKTMLERRRALAGALPHAGEQLAAHAALLSAQCVAAYRPIRAEIDPLPLALAVAGANAIALPVTDGKTMSFRAWRPGEPLAKGAFEIEEPQGPAAAPDLLLVPMLAFTRRGDRLGYGAGHYDRYLARHPETRAVGVAFAGQEVDALPVEPHDKSLFAIATERELIVVGEAVCG